MRLGLDLHGVIDSVPKMFSELTQAMAQAGHEVHILTGPPITEEIKASLIRAGIFYTHLFSIVDYHESVGNKIEYDANGNAHLDPYLWDKTKAEYCMKHRIDLHIDDSDVYGYFFKTPYARFFSKNGLRQEKMKI